MGNIDFSNERTLMARRDEVRRDQARKGDKPHGATEMIETLARLKHLADEVLAIAERGFVHGDSAKQFFDSLRASCEVLTSALDKCPEAVQKADPAGDQAAGDQAPSDEDAQRYAASEERWRKKLQAEAAANAARKVEEQAQAREKAERNGFGVRPAALASKADLRGRSWGLRSRRDV